MDLVWPPPPPGPASASASTSEPSPTSLPLPHPEAYPGEPREYARALMQRKDDIDKEIEALKDVLSSHNANASTPLVDPEGYPRGDIDIYAIRHARSALVRLQNDRQEVMDRLAPALEEAFAAGPTELSSNQINGNGNDNDNALHSIPQQPATQSQTQSHSQANGHAWPERPIARVNSVAPNSPAHESGLRKDDLIFAFGGVTVDSPGGLQAIGTLVASSENTFLSLLILRGEERIQLTLIPRNGWGGRGMLGCHILPV